MDEGATPYQLGRGLKMKPQHRHDCFPCKALRAKEMEQHARTDCLAKEKSEASLTPEETIHELAALMYGHDPDDRNFCKMCTQRSPCLTRFTCEAAIETIKALITDRLPKTADGVPIVPGTDTVWTMHDEQRGWYETSGPIECAVFNQEDDDYEGAYVIVDDVRATYSTREACESANQKEDHL